MSEIRKIIKEEDLIRLFTKEEYRILYQLWMKNIKKPKCEAICLGCSDIWNDILIIHEPYTEYLTLSYKERMKSLEISDPEDKDKYIHFK